MKRAFVLLAFAIAAHAQLDPATLRPVGYHLGPVAYYNAPYFANLLYQGGEWYSFTGTEFGTPIAFDTAQFENGYPKFLQPGHKLRAVLFGLNIGEPRAALARGRIAVSWKGNADVRLAGCGGSPTGTVVDGRREYICAEPAGSLEVHAIVTPVTELRVSPVGLETQLFHPLLLQRIADEDWAFIRFMDWGATNGSPQREWSDRRLPSHVFMNGVLHGGDRETGVAFEHMIALCNATGRDLWINVPHMASDDFIRQLATLIRSTLRADLRVYVEYSNEIWSGGFNFPQGDWAEAEAAKVGISRARFNGRRFCDTWRIFQDVFGGTARLVRVAATFTGNDAYTQAFLGEIAAYGPALNPPVRADVLAVTTYFGNDIQRRVQQHGTAGAFDEWTRRILAGEAASGIGPDATGIGGGFSAALREYGLPIIAYEGGPSLYTTEFDDYVTRAVIAMNRDPRIADVYRIHLELAKSKGLWTHTPYTDTSPWSRFGQWGHLESLDQPPADSPKYALLREHFHEHEMLRHIDAPIGSVPRFVTNAILPPGVAGSPYATSIVAEGAQQMTVIGAYLDPGLTITGDLRITGTPRTSRKNYVFVRANDADGDPAWRIFTLETFGGPGTLVQSDFRGTSTLPWTATHVLDPRVQWTGWTLGPAATRKPAENALAFSISGSSSPNDQFIRATVTTSLDLRGAEVRFSVRRIDFHSPLRYALFVNGTQIYTSETTTKDDFTETEHVATIPTSTTGTVDLRIYAFGAEFDGHATSLTAFKLTLPVERRRAARH